ncbi:MAG TPA: VWA domain-containing protein [Vicinamibacterales bacterium]|nr:VWA domain-containing protein [Vicinamibacterales bacterium]
MRQAMRSYAGILVAALTTWGAAAEDRPLAALHLSVTDERGRTLRNLLPADVEILEQGQRREVRSIAFQGDAPRQIAFFLDEYHVSDGVNADRARAQALRFIDDHVRPVDAVTLMKPLDAPQSIRPAASLDEARRRITAFRGRKGRFQPEGAFEAEYMSTEPAAAARQRQQVVRAAIESLVTALHEPVDSPKALIVITEGFRSDERTRLRTTTMRAVARAARLAHVAIYVLDPSDAPGAQSLPEGWRGLAAETGGAVMTAGRAGGEALARVSRELDGRYLVRFEASGIQDGAFHPLDVRVRRRGAAVHAPSGYWAPFAPSTVVSRTPSIRYDALLTPHVSGLIQPWFRMAPAGEGKTRVTVFWTPRPAGGAAGEVTVAAIAFDGTRLHEATIASRRDAAGPGETSFEAPPGPLQIAMTIASAARGVLATDVRYIDIPRFEGARPVIAGVEFIRPRSLPEFTSLRDDPAAVPTDVRDFLRQDRLLVRVRAFAGQEPARTEARLLNSRGGVLLELPRMGVVDGSTQFELPLARFARGEYRVEIRALGGGAEIAQLVRIRLIG